MHKWASTFKDFFQLLGKTITVSKIKQNLRTLPRATCVSNYYFKIQMKYPNAPQYSPIRDHDWFLLQNKRGEN